jgi:hypothetical protein
MKTMNQNLKSYAATVLALRTLVTTASAVSMLPYTSWHELIENSPDIVIARCTKPHQSRIVLDHMRKRRTSELCTGCFEPCVQFRNSLTGAATLTEGGHLGRYPVS